MQKLVHHHLQKAKVILHVGQLAQLGAPPSQLDHLLLQPLDLNLHLAAQGGLMGAQELTDLSGRHVDCFDELSEHISGLLLQCLNQSLGEERHEEITEDLQRLIEIHIFIIS